MTASPRLTLTRRSGLEMPAGRVPLPRAVGQSGLPELGDDHSPLDVPAFLRRTDS